MRTLQGRDKALLFGLMVMSGAAVPVTQAGAAMVERSPIIGTPMPRTSTHGAVSGGSDPVVDAGPPGAGSGIGQGGLVSIRFLDAAWSATGPYATASQVAFLIPNDPFGLWSTENDETASVAPAQAGYNARVREGLPVIVSAAAVMVTALLGWRLIAPPPPQRRKTKRRRRSYSSDGAGADDDTTVGDVVRFIASSITPRVLKRRKRSRRRSSSSRAASAGDTGTVGEVARAIVETVTPQRRHKKRRRRSRRSTAIQHDMRPT